MAKEYGSAAQWQEDLYQVLRHNGVTLFCYVPDGGHKTLINRSIEDPDVVSVPLTTEEEGVAMCAGCHLGGTKSVLLMQSSGVGNCVNMFALVKNGLFPFVTLITMRGEFGEMNPWQIPMGQGVQPVVEAMGLHCLRAMTPSEVVPTAQAAMDMAYKSNQGVAVLLTQKLIGAKPF
ncbi:MAG: phosphonopyruvate decarboxylase [Rhodospirillaceae bacterium]|nr:phosphonopyruvate decarboxylase [Rhodospirillaceae bacterium]